jgi:Domain of unknown function (DUF4384)
MKIATLTLFFLIVSSCTAAQDTSGGSAKALFGPVNFPKAPEDHTQAAASPSSPGSAVARKSSSQPTSVGSDSSRPTGLRYWVELIKPGSTHVLRVNANRVFHSGERIRLHLQSNVGGRILLVELNPNGTSQILFPDRRINQGDSHIEAGTDTPIPAANAWLTFDSHPSVEKLIVFLEPDVAPRVRRQMQETTPIQPQHDIDSIQVAPGERIDLQRTSTLVSAAETGRKSLVLEIDDKSDAPAGYVVDASPAARATSTPQRLAVEIRLIHQ